MKKYFTLMSIVMLTVFSSCCSDSVTNKRPEELKVLSWNIWHGGHQKLIPSYGCKGTLGILKQIDADVMLIIETYGSSDEIADSMGYYHRLLSTNLSIYSRYPITKTYTFPDSISTFNFGGVEIDMDGQKVRVFNTWLDYKRAGRIPANKSEAEILAWDDAGSSRNDEIRRILTVIKPFLAETDSIPLIMGGDFNTPSHLDWTEATKDMYGHGGAVVNWTVTKEMENAGFEDSFREINPDPVKNLGSTWMHPYNEDWEFRRSAIERTGKRMPYTESDSLRSNRIDYIFYQGSTLDAIASGVYNKDIGETISVNGEDFVYASDHGFVLTTFKFVDQVH